MGSSDLKISNNIAFVRPPPELWARVFNIWITAPLSCKRPSFVGVRPLGRLIPYFESFPSLHPTRRSEPAPARSTDKRIRLFEPHTDRNDLQTLQMIRAFGVVWRTARSASAPYLKLAKPSLGHGMRL